MKHRKNLPYRNYSTRLYISLNQIYLRLFEDDVGSLLFGWKASMISLEDVITYVIETLHLIILWLDLDRI